MVDVVDRATRSRMMSGIRGKDTKPEILVRKALHARGFRYRLHVAGLPGKPDLVFPRYRAVLFIHGCFWHGHDCRYFRLPATRPEFWTQKIRGNQDRDRRQVQTLKEAGWRTLVVWECMTRKGYSIPFDGLVDCIADWLVMGKNPPFADADGRHVQ